MSMNNNFEQAKKKIIKLISSFHYIWAREVFSDFVKMSAISIQNSLKMNVELENEYLRIVKKYKKEDIEKFSQMLAEMIIWIDGNFWDFLGEIYMSTEQGNKNLWQFFTPFNISSFMSQILFSDKIKEIQEKWYIKLQEPASGTGGMIIAAAETLKKYWYNYQKQLLVESIELDETTFYMCYLQLSLYGISWKIIHWNTLTGEKYKIFYTPMYAKRELFIK